jgi:integrase
MHADGGGLYLQASVGADDGIRKSWIFRYAVAGRERQMGLGSLDVRTLSEAREEAARCRKLRFAGIDPLENRNASRAATALQAATAMTFDQCATAYIKAHSAGWRNAKHHSQWTNTLNSYASPVLGEVAVQGIDTTLVMKVLEPLWSIKPETASRLRGRIESVLDWARVKSYRSGENPARWRGHLDHLLPARAKVQKVEHHKAMKYEDLPSFMAELRGHEDVAPAALEFTILNAARTGEVLGAVWDEIDLAAKVWTVPASRMKGHIEHRVPLTDAAVAVLERMQKVRINDYIFPRDRKAGLSERSMLNVLGRMGRAVTTHGFRSSFRTWAAEQTSNPSNVIEMALAHVVGSKVENAYQRSDLFDKRRLLMQQWAEFSASDLRLISPQ